MIDDLPFLKVDERQFVGVVTAGGGQRVPLSASGMMFSGRSARATCSPAGFKVQPLGRRKPFSVAPA